MERGINQCIYPVLAYFGREWKIFSLRSKEKPFAIHFSDEYLILVTLRVELGYPIGLNGPIRKTSTFSTEYFSKQDCQYNVTGFNCLITNSTIDRVIDFTEF